MFALDILRVPQIVGGDAEGDGHVEGLFHSGHGDVQDAVAARQELGVDAGALVANNEDEGPVRLSRSGAEQALRALLSFQRP